MDSIESITQNTIADCLALAGVPRYTSRGRTIAIIGVPETINAKYYSPVAEWDSLEEFTRWADEQHLPNGRSVSHRLLLGLRAIRLYLWDDEDVINVNTLNTLVAIARR